MPTKNFRKRTLEQDPTDPNDEEEERRSALEEVKLLQKLRERKLGIPALTASHSTPAAPGGPLKRPGDKGDTGDGEEELVLQDTFAQETAVTIEDPNMLKYVEQELAKRKGKNVDAGDNEDKDPVDELYVIPEHLKVKKRNSEESSTQWTTGIAEVQLPIEYKLRNIEETEAAKKLLQEKRLAGRTKSELNIPSSFSADYFQRGRDYAEKLRRDGCEKKTKAAILFLKPFLTSNKLFWKDSQQKLSSVSNHPELYKERGAQVDDTGIKPTESNNQENPGRRQAATDELMLERFRKRERHRGRR